MKVPEMFAPSAQISSLNRRRFIEHLDPGHEEPEPEETSNVCDWLSTVPPPPPKVLAEISRPRSLPARFNDNQIPPTLEDLRGCPKSPLVIDEIGGRPRTGTTTNTTKINIAGLRYRSSLPYNSMEHDPIALNVPPTLKEMLDEQILMSRTKSPPLPPDRIVETMKAISEWESSTEKANNFAYSDLFPVHRRGIRVAGNSQWSRAALPQNLDYKYPVSTPKPDFHVGYSHGRRGGFSAQQGHVINHVQAMRYTQPATGNVMPFLVVEIKSEATGGTLYHAENQAIGSGTICVKSLEWLLEKAGASQINRLIDTISFSMAVTGRVVVLSVHWYSPEDEMYYMSGVKTFVTTNPQDIQACHSTVKNIVDWAVGPRLEKIKEVLQRLFPLSQQCSEEDEDEDDEEEDDEEEEVIIVEQRSTKRRKLEPRRRCQRPAR